MTVSVVRRLGTPALARHAELAGEDMSLSDIDLESYISSHHLGSDAANYVRSASKGLSLIHI